MKQKILFMTIVCGHEVDILLHDHRVFSWSWYFTSWPSCMVMKLIFYFMTIIYGHEVDVLPHDIHEVEDPLHAHLIWSWSWHSTSWWKFLKSSLDWSLPMTSSASCHPLQILFSFAILLVKCFVYVGGPWLSCYCAAGMTLSVSSMPSAAYPRPRLCAIIGVGAIELS